MIWFTIVGRILYDVSFDLLMSMFVVSKEASLILYQYMLPRAPMAKSQKFSDGFIDVLSYYLLQSSEST